MKVFMLNPPFISRFSRQSRSPCSTKGGTFYYPYYLAYAAGAVEQAGFNTRLVDAVANEWSHDETVKYAKKFNPDLVVVDTSTPSFYNDVEVAEKIKSVLPNTHINLAGIHVTNVPEESVRTSTSIDSISRGEFDYTSVDLARAIESGKELTTVDGITFRDGENIVDNKPRMLIQDLDSLPFVSEVYKNHFGRKGIEKYFYASITWPEVTILTARGCNFACSFCNIPWKSSYRARSAKNVVDEFEYIENELPYVNEISIEDDTFPVDKNRTLEVCDLINQRGIKIKWSCNGRVNSDLDTLKRMRKANCRLLCVGFESPRQNVLNAINKGSTEDLQERFMKNSRDAGLIVNGCFILGLPNDTSDSMQNTIDFAKKLNPDTAQFYPLMAYPGTEAYRWAKDSDMLHSEDYSEFLRDDGSHSTNMKGPGGMSRDELLKWCDKARKEYYLRKEYVFYKLAQVATDPDELVRTYISASTFFRHLANDTFGSQDRAVIKLQNPTTKQETAD